MNKEQLNEAIIREAFEQGVEVPKTEDMTKKELQAVLDKLANRAPESNNDVPPAPPVLTDGVPPPPAEVKCAEVKHVVAPGKSLTCLKGVLTEGDVIKPEYINGGCEPFELLKEQKYIIEFEEKE